MWNCSIQYRALATRKLRTSLRPKLNTRVPQSGCSPWRGSACSYRAVPSKRARANSSRGKWAGTQSTITPMPRWCRASTRARKSSGRAEAGGRGVVARHLVAPRPAEGVLGDRHHLDVGEAQLGHVVGQLLGQLPVGQRAAGRRRRRRCGATSPGGPRRPPSAARSRSVAARCRHPGRRRPSRGPGRRRPRWRSPAAAPVAKAIGSVLRMSRPSAVTSSYL